MGASVTRTSEAPAIAATAAGLAAKGTSQTSDATTATVATPARARPTRRGQRRRDVSRARAGRRHRTAARTSSTSPTIPVAIEGEQVGRVAGAQHVPAEGRQPQGSPEQHGTEQRRPGRGASAAGPAQPVAAGAGRCSQGVGGTDLGGGGSRRVAHVASVGRSVAGASEAGVRRPTTPGTGQDDQVDPRDDVTGGQERPAPAGDTSRDVPEGGRPADFRQPPRAAAADATRAVGRGIGRAATGAARVTARSGRYAARRAHRFTHAGGAGESGLARVTELQASHTAGDTVMMLALAGTLFLNPQTAEARSEVAAFLLLTMVPFVLVAPFIGPLLDRFSHGRRWAIGTTTARARLPLLGARRGDRRRQRVALPRGARLPRRLQGLQHHPGGGRPPAPARRHDPRGGQLPGVDGRRRRCGHRRRHRWARPAGRAGVGTPGGLRRLRLRHGAGDPTAGRGRLLGGRAQPRGHRPDPHPASARRSRGRGAGRPAYPCSVPAATTRR